jgi:hypothetical protein
MQRIPVKASREGNVPLRRPAAAHQTGQEKTQETPGKKGCDDYPYHIEGLLSPLLLLRLQMKDRANHENQFEQYNHFICKGKGLSLHFLSAWMPNS